jgi:hypothetical protein
MVIFSGSSGMPNRGTLISAYYLVVVCLAGLAD